MSETPIGDQVAADLGIEGNHPAEAELQNADPVVVMTSPYVIPEDGDDDSESDQPVEPEDPQDDPAEDDGSE